MSLMPVWPAGFLPTPSAENWEGAPYDSRAAFQPELGPPLFRSRVTAEAWTFTGTFPAADQAERAAFMAFWAEIQQGALPFLWRDPEDQAVRKWIFADGEPVRTSRVSDTNWDFHLKLIRLPSTPWWAGLIPADRTIAPVAAYDFQRGLYHTGAAQVGRSSAFTFSRASAAAWINSASILVLAAAGDPRFDRWPVTGLPRGLLIEPARTNLLLQSAAFDTASWTKLNATVTANAVAAPDGATAADTLAETTATGTHEVSQAAGTVGAADTLSVFAKAGTRSWIALQLGTAIAYFNVSTGALGSVTGGTATITAMGSGWYRCTLSVASRASTVNKILLASASGTSSYTGVATNNAYIWGAQLETGSTATSYIATAAATAARAADAAGLVTAHGLCDARVVYDDGSATTLLNQTLAAGWWPTQARPHVAGIGIFEAGALA